MALQRPRILLVDDDLDIRLLLKAALSDEGYQVVATGNGLEAIQQAMLDPPDLIILDLMMPEMSGPELAARLSQEGRGAPPLLVISAASDADRVAGDLGASRLLHKPFDLQTLLDDVAALTAREA
jgi:DNA-binding response OmpR family regulator